MKRDSCDWCGRETNKLQMQPGENFGLCPDCCPDLDLSDIMFGIEDPDDPLPSSWYHMSREERQAWNDGMSMEEIIEEFNWHEHPERRR